ncbi:valine--tRNA ligase [Candidatus Parcubacteria bacterium]|nr:valine--tRNA ligase [Patescibacteria group bacterium]MCG2689049.1 valine--tRNA ligase [Candidatus Parcubacteria bacterium]
MSLEKTYHPELCEESLYKMWEEGGYFTPKIDKTKKPYSILLPLPNASDPMHMGNMLFTIQDVLARWHRMMGDPTLWLPGGDHAGIETQYVYEKHLVKQGTSRLNYDRYTLYKMIADFVEKNKGVNKNQMRRMGFSLDWTRYKYSLDTEIVKKVLETFSKLHKDGLVYRGERLVNYCAKCGTALSDLEVNHIAETATLYFLDYETIQIATTRPETIFADSAVAVNPRDKRYKNLVGKDAIIPLINKKIPIISDEAVEKDFGTGALKITPAHDALDNEIGQKHKLNSIKCIDIRGKMMNVPAKYLGMNVPTAREAVLEDLKKEGKLIKEIPLEHTINTCYKCNKIIEPTLIPQWYVRTKPLAIPAIKAIKEGKTKIVPKKRFEKMYFDWLENIHDWNISRQIVWGPRIPAWFCLDCNPDIEINFIDKRGQKVFGEYKKLRKKYEFSEIEKGLQSLSAPVDAKYSLDKDICHKCSGKNVLQETDTFDTWFLSGQWPLTTLGFPESEDFKYFYPTSVLDTMWDILFFWVARMMMLCIYNTGQVPFKTIHLHARVVDKHGVKMSKSKGNTIDPMEMVNKYGADAVRMALIFGVAPASDVVVSEDKIRAMRNFANKIWNIGRFLEYSFEQYGKEVSFYSVEMKNKLTPSDLKLLRQLKLLVAGVTKSLDTYQFSRAGESLYEFVWHTLADVYVEEVKTREDKEVTLMVLRHVYLTCLKLLHPFMPFVTEELWSKIPRKSNDPLIISSWPK